jgi:hypothetical protein
VSDLFLGDYFGVIGKHRSVRHLSEARGWSFTEYTRLLDEMLKARLGNSATQKGRTLETLVLYVLNNGAIALWAKELKDNGVWQTDGFGAFHPEAMDAVHGHNSARFKSGFVAEAKNYKDPITVDEFAEHENRCGNHDVLVGLLFAPGGLAMTGGIGNSARVRALRGVRLHIFFSAEALHEMREEYPLHVFLQESCAPLHDLFGSDEFIQRHSGSTCKARFPFPEAPEEDPSEER